jgi:hypothetical protein
MQAIRQLLHIRHSPEISPNFSPVAP